MDACFMILNNERLQLAAPSQKDLATLKNAHIVFTFLLLPSLLDKHSSRTYKCEDNIILTKT